MSYQIMALIGLTAVSLILLNNSSSDEGSYQLWKHKYGKLYDSNQDLLRMRVFQENKEAVKNHNRLFKLGLATYEMELNEFADLSADQFAELYLMKNFKTGSTKCNASIPTADIPDQVDWTTQGAVTAVKNQGQCGSCWSFSTTGALEGLNYITNKKLLSFSEQQMVDCSSSYGNMGCNGGLMNQSMWYVKDNGIALQSAYPYTGVGGKCKYDTSMESFRNKDCAEVTVNSEKSLKMAIANGPVSVAIQANQLGFQLYKKGVFTGACGHNLDHGVLAVGYGTEEGKGYYKIKNSWGAGWGMTGYILLGRSGDGPGQCGVQMAATLPL